MIKAVSLYLAILLLLPLVVLSGNSSLTPEDIIYDDSLGLIYPLDEVVYLASKIEDANASNPVIILQNSPELEASDVSKILMKTPGLSFSTGRKNSLDLKIRGSNSQSTLVLLNGRPINSGYFGSVDLSMIPVYNLSEVKIAKGPASVAYGPGGLGGVINFVTNKNEKEGSSLYSSYISISPAYETNTYFSASKNYSNSSLFLSLGKTYREAFRMSLDFDPVFLENGGNRDNSDLEETSLLFDYSYQVSPSFRVALTLNGYVGDKGVPGSIYENQFWRYDDITRMGSLISWDYSTNKKKSFLGSIYANNYSDRLISYADRNYSSNHILFDSKIKNNTFGSDISVVRQSKKHTLHYGLKVKVDNSKRENDPSESYKTLTSSLFIEDKIKDLWMGTLTIGSGLHFQNRFELESGPSNEYTTHVKYSKPFTDFLQTHIAFGRNVFFPTMHNLYSDIKGNPELKAEVGYKAESGLQTKLNMMNSLDIHAGMVIFYQSTKNQIVVNPVSDRFKNLEELQSWGMEIQFSALTRDMIQIKQSYGIIKWGEDELDNYLELPKYTLSSTLIFTPGKRSTLMFTYVLNGKRNSLNHLGSQIEYSPYSLVNSSLTYRFPKWLSFTIAVENIQDTDYYSSYGYPAPGRMYWLKMGFRLEKSGDR